MTAFTIAVTSDTVCPWCYVGKAKLEAGIAAYQKAANSSSSSSPSPSSNDTFTTTWHPFYLNPDAPQQGTDKRALYAAKFGPERTALIQQRLAAEGAKIGIDFRFGGKTGNTRKSHRLIRRAGEEGGPEVQGRVVAELFRAYFEREEDITDNGVLERAAERAGLAGGEDVAGFLAGEEGGEEVDAEVGQARRAMVAGVPHFVINGKYEIQGAQDAEGFKRAFERIKELGG